MKPVRQQRAGCGYLDAVLRDAARPYAFRGGLLRLLNAGAASPMRAAHTYGSLPFNLKYLQHSAYGYGGEGVERLTAAPAPVAADTRSTMPERPPAFSTTNRAAHNTESGSEKAQHQQTAPIRQSGVSMPGRSPEVKDQQPGEPISNDRFRQGPPPLVTSRSIDNPQSNIRPASAASENSRDNIAVDNYKQSGSTVAGRNREFKPADKTVNHSQLLSRLARQLEEHNFGGQTDFGTQSGSAESRSGISASGTASRSKQAPAFLQQNRLRSSGRIEADAAGPGGAVNRPAADRIKTGLVQQERNETQPAALPGLPAHMPLQEQLRLVRNLKRQVTVAQRPETEETPAREPVKAKKKPPALAAKKTIQIVRQTIVRRVAAPAFWERSYLAHAALRIYK